MPIEVVTITEDKTGKSTRVTLTDPALIKIKQDTAKFAVERLGRDDWSTRTELTGKDGAALPTPILNTLIINAHAVPSDDGGSQDLSPL